MKSIADSKILYLNRYLNVCYSDGEILELTKIKGKDDTVKDVIFELFAKVLTRCSEQRQVYKYLVYTQNEANVSAICNTLAEKHGKSQRTYRRAIDSLNKGRILSIKNGVVHLRAEYDLSLFDLDNTKAIVINIQSNEN